MGIASNAADTERDDFAMRLAEIDLNHQQHQILDYLQNKFSAVWQEVQSASAPHGIIQLNILGRLISFIL
jgi:hypothetical protein